MKLIGKLCCALLILSMMVGCSRWQVLTALGVGAAGAGIAAVYYTKGDLEADISDSVNHVYQAAVSTMKKRAYTVTDKNLNDDSGRIEATIPASGSEKAHNIVIKMQRKEGVTHISIRVGVFGDESLSRSILDDIRVNLNTIVSESHAEVKFIDLDKGVIS